ncbi:MAG: serine hydrolase [Candidatus Limnocylindria bacterium]
MTRLLEAFRKRARGAGGRVGAMVVDADGHEVMSLDADDAMFAASVIKLPIVMTLYADAADGRLSLEEQVAVGSRLGGSGVLRHLRDVERMSLRDLATLAMAVSDNTATNRIIERIGIDRVNERLDQWDCPTTRVRRTLFDWEARSRGLENVMTPREAASLLRRLLGEVAEGSQPAMDVLALLERNSDVTRLGRYLPKGVSLSHKDGWGDDPDPVENDVGIVRAKFSVVAVGLTFRVPLLVARPLLGLLGLAAAEIAGAELGPLPFEVSGTA